ncbi:MAG: alpha/beta fold hydrolase [Rhodothermaceae bacterium]|nr:alpha/beta fold hydrolase [Rhodothermaceae bacterium]
MNLFYKDYAPEHTQPLLILHGLLGAGGNWHSLSRNVFSKHYRVLAVDLRNHGKSPHSDTFDFPSMVEDVRELMDTMGFERAHILGHSMGGKVAMWFGLMYPERVDKLIVADIAPRAYPPHHLPIFEGLRALDLPSFQSRGEIDAALATHVAEAPVRQFLLKNLASDGAGSYSWKMNLETIYENYPLINKAVVTDRTFNKPTLFIRGGRSSYIRKEDEPAILTLFPDTEFITIPNAGHWVHAEAPQPFANSVLEFLGT